VQNKVAQFGSRLTDLETQFDKSETDLKSDLNELKHNLAKDYKKASETHSDDKIDLDSDTSLPGGSEIIPINPVNGTGFEQLNGRLKSLDTRVVNLDARLTFVGTNLTEQLQRQEERASKSWKLLGDLQDDIQNVSAKAYSNDVRYQNTQKHL
jgi:hypothetical protein